MKRIYRPFVHSFCNTSPSEGIIMERYTMIRFLAVIICSIALLGGGSSARAEKLFSMGIGMKWPQALLSSGIPTGDAEVNYGAMVDRKVGFGVAADFLWNVQSDDQKDSSSHYIAITERKTFMFPIMGFFLLDPVPNLVIHPVGRFEIGYNSMIYSYKSKDTAAGAAVKPLSPYFYGLIIKASLDGLYNIGERSALFLGLEFQWAGTSTTNNTEGLFDKRDMSGIGLRAGFRVTI
jgi:hypothetical protein